MTDTVKYLLAERDIPTHWYNIAADLPVPLPPVLHPGTRRPIGPDDLAPLISHLTALGQIEPRAYGQLDCFAAGKLQDQAYDESELAMALAGLPSVA